MIPHVPKILLYIASIVCAFASVTASVAGRSDVATVMALWTIIILLLESSRK